MNAEYFATAINRNASGRISILAICYIYWLIKIGPKATLLCLVFDLLEFYISLRSFELQNTLTK